MGRHGFKRPAQPDDAHAILRALLRYAGVTMCGVTLACVALDRPPSGSQGVEPDGGPGVEPDGGPGDVYTPEGNRPPVIETGERRVFPAPGKFMVEAGKITDDGRGAAPLEYSWTALKGPTRAVFTTTNSARVDVYFILPGTYQLELKVKDNGLETSATIDVEVLDLHTALIAHWPFDDGSDKAKDVSRSGLELALSGAGWEPGVIGMALDLSGNNDWGSVTDTNKAFAFADDFSIAFWFKTDQRAQGTNIPTVFRYTTVSETNYHGWEVSFGANGILELKTIDNDVGSYVGRAALNDGKWHHFVGQRKGTVLQAWIDGMFVRSTTSTVQLRPVGEFQVGGAHGDPTIDFDGSLDDVWVFSRALSANEIATLADEAIVGGWKY